MDFEGHQMNWNEIEKICKNIYVRYIRFLDGIMDRIWVLRNMPTRKQAIILSIIDISIIIGGCFLIMGILVTIASHNWILNSLAIPELFFGSFLVRFLQRQMFLDEFLSDVGHGIVWKKEGETE